MFLFDKYHTGKQYVVAGNQCELRWKTMLPSMPKYAAESMATYDEEGNLYFGCHSGMFYSLDHDGHIRWSFHTTEKNYASPLLYKDTVITTTGDGLMICFFKDSGKIKWLVDLKKGYFDNKTQKIIQTLIHLPYTYSLRRKMNINTKCWSSPLLLDDKLFITSFGKGFYCIDPNNGKELWSLDLGFPRFHLSGVVSDDENYIYFGSRKREFFKYDTNGNCCWKLYRGGFDFWGAPSYDKRYEQILLPLSRNENKGIVEAISKGGRRNWSLNLKGAIYGSVANDVGIGFCSDFAGFLYKIDLSDGSIMQEVKISNATRALWTTPVIDAEGSIYIVTKDSDSDGRLIKLDDSLHIIWEKKIGKSLSSPVILNSGDICVGSWDGFYYCFKTL